MAIGISGAAVTALCWVAPALLAGLLREQQFGRLDVYPTAFTVNREGRVIKNYLYYIYPVVFKQDVKALLSGRRWSGRNPISMQYNR
ncbi:MAG: hypothetical protein AB7U82_13200 [Blastocatellales bacterium]